MGFYAGDAPTNADEHALGEREHCIECGRFTSDGGRLCRRCVAGAKRFLREPWWLRIARWLVR